MIGRISRITTPNPSRPPTRAYRGDPARPDRVHAEPKGIFALALFLHNSDRKQEAEQWYLRAAKVVNAAAMNNLGVLAEDDDRVQEAGNWYRMAVDREDPDAVFNLGALAENSGDAEAAQRWYLQAASEDDVEAMFLLGFLLETEEKRVEAMFRLGLQFVERERDEAAHWYRQAMFRGHPEASKALGQLRKKRPRLLRVARRGQAAPEPDPSANGRPGLADLMRAEPRTARPQAH